MPKLKNKTSPYNVEYIYHDLPDKKLKSMIHKRNIQRLPKLIQEVKRLHDKHGLSWKRLHELGLEYRYTGEYIKGIISTKQNLIEILDQKTWRYVKRQRTWFKKHLPHL